MRGLARHLAVAQGDQLTDFFIQQPVNTVAGCMRRQPQRLAVERCEDALGRNVIPVLAVAGHQIVAAQVAERQVLDAPIIALTQHAGASSIPDQEYAKAAAQPRPGAASNAIGNCRVHQFYARQISVKRCETIFYEPSGFGAVGGRTDNDLFQSATGGGPPVEFPIANERIGAAPIFHVGRGPVASKQLLESKYVLILVALVLEEHHAANNVHGVVDQQVRHVGMERVASDARRSRKADKRINKINQLGLNAR